jgi:hypothetical protein
MCNTQHFFQRKYTGEPRALTKRCIHSADAFHSSALRTYIGRFQFDNDPLDVALRKLLVDVGLPRETQQIDRVIEAFSARYAECNPGLFSAEGASSVQRQSRVPLT